MRYVLRADYAGKVLLHNVVTGQLVVLEQEEAEALERLPVSYIPAFEQLVAGHYLVPKDYDEYKSVNQLRMIYQMQKKRSTGDAINHYIILPTTFCNARCFYCYESDYPRVQMTEETASKLVDYIEKHRESKDITIQWFGGEPLVGLQRIDQISQGLRDRGIKFTSSMISNGFLFDDNIIDRSISLWNLERVQITLDGTEETYNRVKAYVNAQDNPFQRVLKNIDKLSENSIRVNIRLNIDKYNKDDISILIDELGERYSGNKYVSVYLNMLFNNTGYEPIQHSYDDIISITELIAEYNERLRGYRLAIEDNSVPYLKSNQCMADNPHTVMIQPDGSFCRCEHENVLDSYGNLDEGILYPQKLEDWHESKDQSPRCHECNLYPVCYHLRNCMNSDMPCIEQFQEMTIKKQMERIRAIYVRKMEGEKNEGFRSSSN